MIIVRDFDGGKTFYNKNQRQEFVKNIFASKPAEFCPKALEELLDKWQQVTSNNGE